MKKFIRIFFMVLFLVFIFGCSTNISDLKKNNQKITLPSEKDPIQEQLNKMTLNEKIGQMIIAGFEGTSINSKTEKIINKYKLGGLILYQTNIKDATQLVDLTNSIKSVNAKNKLPLFISIDQEGGRVNRLPASILNTPSARTIGDINDEKLAYDVGSVIANELQAFGFNMDFAPVLDIQSNPHNTVIGERSFGSNAENVSKLGVTMMKGVRSGNVIPVVKHFPGHGDTFVDSHLDLPKILNNLDRLKKLELIPFKNAIKNHADMVMVAHILLQNIDPTYPASMSKTIITDLLRKQYGFKGVVITDDITMGAITKHYNLQEATINSLNAGSDIILVGHNIENVKTIRNCIYSAVQKNLISEENIDKSVYRILALKSKYKINNKKITPVNENELNNLKTKILSKESIGAINSSKINYLLTIESKGKVGSITNFDFHLNSTTIDEVEKCLGKADQYNFVESVNGTYCTFSKKDIVVAYNKGNSLFEIRSYDPDLNILTIEDIKNHFGPPKTDVKTNNNEEIISYSVGAYTIKFVFPLGKKVLVLDHYSIYNESNEFIK